jgi:hypothetical protein
MADQETDISAVFADFNREITDIEENLRLLKERVLVLSRTVLSQGERLGKEILSLKESISSIRNDLDRQREGFEHIVRESSELVRKEELKSLERYMKMFEPLKFATEDDVRRIVRDMLEGQNK